MPDVYFSLSTDTAHDHEPESAYDPLCQDCAIQLSQLHEPLTSPVQHLLSSTVRHSPSPTEEILIRDAISQVESRINGIDVTTAKIQLLLSNLAEQRARVQAYRDKHKVLVAPVWQIPPEILSYIFVLCLSHRPPNEINRSSLKRSLLLARVNQYWRQVALSTPQLWTIIFLDSKSLGGAEEGHEAPAEPSSSLCMPKVCLERSGACPLSITVFSQEFNVDILDFIIPLSDRWRRISLHTNMTMLQALFPIQGKLSHLEHLEIRNSQWSEGPPPAIGLLSFFSEAPCLKHVMVSNTFQPSFKILPLHQLTSWDSPMRVSDFPQVFKLAPNLEECFLQPLRMFNGTLTSENETTFSHNLTSLHISTGTITNLSVQLHHLPQFPYLRQLFLYCDKRVLINSPENTLVPFFAKSGGQLEYLMFGISVALDMIRQCLAYTPMLTSLHIHRMASDLVLNHLTLQEGYGDGSVRWLVPKLTNLRLSGKLYFQARTVTKLIRSRWSSSPSYSALPSGSTSTSYSSNSDVVADTTTTVIPVHDARPRTLRSVDILPPRHDKFDIDEKNELLALNQQGFEVNIRSLKRSEFLSRNSMKGVLQVGRG
jgi:hypothetical protein